MDRIASITRTTKETKIQLTLNLDGTGKADIQTGIGFFDHMLHSFARHGFFDLTLQVEGDLYVDCHHTIEDVGIVLGEAIKGALGEKNQSSDMVLFSYQWTKHSLCVPLIYRDALILILNFRLR